MNKSLFIFSIILLLMSCQNEEETLHTFFVGGYTLPSFNAEGKGVYTCSLNSNTGEMSLDQVFENTINPSYLAVHPNKKYLYSVNETGGDQPGFVSSYKILEGDSLEFINEQYTRGDYPCHVSISGDGKYLLVANYGGGSVSIFSILENGSLDKLSRVVKHSGKGPFEERQEGPHAHYFGPAINDSTAFAVDLGIDKIIHYRIRDKGSLGIKSATSVTPGTGPRHLVFNPNVKTCYVLLEFNNNIEAFTYEDETKPFKRFQTINTFENELPFYSATSSAIKMHPNGQFLYTANRGIKNAEEDVLALLNAHPQSGKLTFVKNINTKGKVPRDFAIDPTGNILVVANQETGNLVSFKINQETGDLTPTGFELEIKSATCIKFK
ncbi:MAG: lactonase family protein [Bacteroidota bacterium]